MTLKEMWKMFALIIAFVLAVVVDFTSLFIIAPALISAASTLAVICGVVLIVLVLAINIVAVTYIIRKVFNYTHPEEE